MTDIPEAKLKGDVWLLRLRALLARARGDEASLARLRGGYWDLAETLGIEGHLDWAESMDRPPLSCTLRALVFNVVQCRGR